MNYPPITFSELQEVYDAILDRRLSEAEDRVWALISRVIAAAAEQAKESHNAEK